MSGLLLLVDGRCLILVYDVSQRRRTMGSRHEAAHNQASRCDSGWDCQRQSRSAGACSDERASAVSARATYNHCRPYNGFNNGARRLRVS